ncbi:MAG: acyl carrier protein [Clostridia bacterium]|nr:acyl carrier protein [Clostridia bacterium]
MSMFEEVAKVLAEQLNVDVSKITENSEIVKDLGADSLDVVEMLMTLEDNTGKTIPEDKVSDLKTVGDVVKMLETL